MYLGPYKASMVKPFCQNSSIVQTFLENSCQTLIYSKPTIELLKKDVIDDTRTTSMTLF